jgi:hypothetical protein
MWPGSGGVHNWQPMSFNPATGLVYFGSRHNAQAYIPTPPERFKKGGDARSDVYALGLVLYETITGRFPYDIKTSSLMGVLKIIIDEPPKPLQQTFKGGYKLDPDLWTITSRNAHVHDVRIR